MPRGAEWEWGSPRPVPYSSDDERAEREAENSIRLADRVFDLIDYFGDTVRLTPDLILELHRLATSGVLASPGRYREATFLIDGASHVPPKRALVESLVLDMCGYANRRCSDDPIHVAAYLMWRLNWIHPFEDGNGRVSRALAEIGLCVGFGIEPAGPPTIMSLLVRHRQEYLDGLAAADQAEPRDGRPDVAALEGLLCYLLVEQASEADQA